MMLWTWLSRRCQKTVKKWVIYLQDPEDDSIVPIPWTTYDRMYAATQKHWNIKKTTTTTAFGVMDGTGIPKVIIDESSFSAIIPRYLNIDQKIEVYYCVIQLIGFDSKKHIVE